MTKTEAAWVQAPVKTKFWMQIQAGDHRIAAVQVLAGAAEGLVQK